MIYTVTGSNWLLFLSFPKENEKWLNLVGTRLICNYY